MPKRIITGDHIVRGVSIEVDCPAGESAADTIARTRAARDAIADGTVPVWENEAAVDVPTFALTLAGAEVDPEAVTRVARGAALRIAAVPPPGVFPAVVTFYLNGALQRIESSPPYDFNGGTSTTPNSWVPMSYPFTVMAEFKSTTATLAVVEATFDAEAAAPAPSPTPVPPPSTPTPPTPNPSPPTTGVLRSSVTKDGITWHFDGTYECGQFVNGDWWVVGPVGIFKIEPGWDGSRGGSMVNPAYGDNLGYDTKLAYDATKRFESGTLQPGSSLVSTWSWRPGEAGCPPINATTGQPRPLLRRASVLTVLAEPAQGGVFRPAYGGTRKDVLDADGLDDFFLANLPRWPLPATTRKVSDLLDKTRRPWISTHPQWKAVYFHPSENMPVPNGYHRDLAALYNDAALLLCCDIPLEDKRKLAINLAQIGIDDYAILKTGATWGDGGGGVGSGHKLPVLLAGYLLQDSDMLNYYLPTNNIMRSLEDAQTVRDAQGVYWRERVKNDRTNQGNTLYRVCCTANAWAGAVIVVRALGLQSKWNHDAWIDYVSWYIEVDQKDDTTRDRFWSAFARDLWLATNGGRNV